MKWVAGLAFGLRSLCALTLGLALTIAAPVANATPFTMTVPGGDGLVVPPQYPQAGGVVIVLVGVNGNVYYQFADPTGGFVGYQNNGTPSAFRGNPFTLYPSIPFDCGYRSCTDYFGGQIAEMRIRFTAYDGDTQPGGFDENDIILRMNGVNVGNWSNRTTEKTNPSGTVSLGFETGFGNNSLNTGWFTTRNRPALDAMLAAGQSTIMAYDADPNDNYWDFRQGGSLTNPALRTIAPGYELDKTVVGGATTFLNVGQTIQYQYVIGNIGSVDINNVAVVDNKIPNVSCPAPPANNIPETVIGASAPNSITCTASYVVTQADVDAGEITNIAQATGTPLFGTLGPLTDTVTLTTTRTNDMTLTKTASPTTFGAVGSTVTYTFTVQNTGNTTLSNAAVSDPKIPSLSCSFASIPPTAGSNTRTCTGTYTVKQSDVDGYALNGTQLSNTATAVATGPDGATLNRTASRTLPGPVAAPAMTVTKTAVQANYNAVGAVIQFNIAVKNTGNVTWPAAPTVTDPLAGVVNCPTGAVAPNATTNCTANYTIGQADLDAGSITNVANATITAAGQTANGTATVSVPAVQTQALSIVKRLKAGSPSPFTAVGQQLVYEYVLTNNGNVTISAPSVTDDKVGVTCPTGAILPGATVTCTSAAYTVTQADLNTGNVQNTATGSATGPLGAVSTAATSLTVPATQTRALSLAKAGPVVTDLVANTQISYAFTVTNTGNVTLTQPITITDDKIGTNLPCSTAPLPPAQSVTCNIPYTVTAGDVAAGFVTNNATAKSGTTTSNTATATVSPAGAPGITLSKVADTASFDSTSDTLSYTFTVTNSGQVSIPDTMPITIDDPAITISGCVQPAILTPAASYTCTGTFAGLSQVDLDAGEYVNTASASFVYAPFGGPNTTVKSPTSSATVPADITPAFSLTKASADVYSNVNDPVSYTFTVTNLTEQSLTSVVVTDPLIPGLSCTLGPIAGLGTDSCSGTYNVTQADLDAGQVVNTASALGTSPLGETATVTDTETVLINPAAQTKSMSVTKSPSNATYAAVGDLITYTMEVENTGNLTLSNVVVTDAQLGLSCTIGTIAPGTTDTSCTAQKTITQADMDAGSYTNTVSVSAPGATTVTDDATVTGPARVADWTFTKVADGSFATEGDLVVFTFSVANTGNVTLTNLAITDAFFDPDLTCTIGSLAPGASDTTCTGTYAVSQLDVDTGSITNTADLTGNGVANAPISDSATAIVSGPPPAPAMSVTKAEQDGSGTFDDLPTTESFTFTVENTGNVTLSNVVLNDPLTGFTCPIADLAPGDIATSCADTSPLSTTYTVTQADLDAGGLTNTVTVTADPAAGTLAPATAQVTLGAPDQLPALTLDKSATAGANFAAIGDVISYSYLVTNSGNVTLTNPITVTDDKVAVTCPALPSAGLAPLAMITCTASHTVTQADLDAGEVVNVASANVTQAIVPNSTYPTGVAAIASAPDTVTVLAAQNPGIGITKRIKPGTPTTFDLANVDTITFEFLVKITGNVTLLDPILVDDAPLGITDLPCGTPPIAPNTTVTCEATWTATQAAIDLGSFTNSATADTTFGASPVTTPTPGTATALAIRTPELTTAKSLLGINPAGNPNPPYENAYDIGKEAYYQYVVVNTGNVTALAQVTVSDNLIPGVICPNIDLAPGETLTCLGSYVINSDDFALGSVTNIAATSAPLSGGGTVTSDPVSETIPANADPALAVTKSADATSFAAVGDIINYTYVITNTSPGSGTPIIRPAIPVNTIGVTDDKIAGPFTCVHDGNTVNAGYAGTLAPYTTGLPDEIMTCTAPYSVTQADLDRVGTDGSVNGFVTNNANATGTFGSTNIVSPPAQATVDAVSEPELTVTKTVENQSNPGQPAAAGDTLAYTINVANTGNTTLSGITVSDPMLAGLTCPATSLVVAPDTPSSMNCTGTYVVTQADIDAQILTNVATATGSSPQGVDETGMGTVDAVLAAPNPVLFVEKNLASGTPAAAFQSVGEVVDFVITLRNDGNVTLDNVSVEDLFGAPEQSLGTCSIGTLVPGQSDLSCTFSHTITQADIDAGEIVNKAVATAQPANPGALPLTSEDVLTGMGPLRDPTIAISKIADPQTFLNADETITYTYTLVNTGNVTLTELPVITDDKIGAITSCDPFPVGGLLPQGEIACTATYATLQPDVDAGTLTNVVDVTMSNPYPVGPTTLTTSATETIAAARTPAFTIEKTPSILADATVGAVITYTYRVENTGNVTLTNVTLTDDHTSAAGTAALTLSDGGIIATLLPGDVVELTADYTVTQADIDAGQPLTNIVTGNATSPSGTTASEVTDDASVEVIAADPKLIALKSVASPLPTGILGETITYDISVENTGNVTLTAPVFDDTLTHILDGSLVSDSLVPSYVSGDDDLDGKLGVGEIWVYSLSHIITQDDVDLGGLSNTLTATATDPSGTEVSDLSDTGTGTGSDPAEVAIDPVASAEILKTVRTTPADLIAGEDVVFEIRVSNTGTVSLSDIVITDTLTRRDTPPTPVSPAPAADYESGDTDIDDKIDVSETWVYTVTHTLTQADIDAGGIDNTATLDAQAPDGSPVTSDVAVPAEVPIVPAPALQVLKTIPTPPASLVDGAEVTWQITVENTGNVTLTAPILADTLENAKGDPLTAPIPAYQSGDLVTIGSLDVGEVWVYEATYTLTQADVDAGGITNSVTATATDPNGTETTDDSSDDPGVDTNPTVLTITPAPSLEVVKTIPTPPVAVLGAVVDYEITVQNTGNVTLTNVGLVDDLTTLDLGTAVSFTGPTLLSGDTNDDLNLGVGETWIYVVSHTIDQTDIDQGGLTNTVTVTAEDPDGVERSDVSNNAPGAGDTPTDFPIVADPKLEVIKTVRTLPTDYVVGAEVVFDVTIANTGNVTLTAPVLTETLLRADTTPVTTPPSAVFESADLNTDGLLDVGETWTYSVTYALEQADIDAGGLSNSILAETMTTGPSPVPATDTSDNGTGAGDDPTLVDLVQTPEMTVIKALDAPGPYALGDTLAYTITVENSGNVTLTAPTLADTLTRNTGAAVTPAPVPAYVAGDAGAVGMLDVGEVWTFTASHVITQDDVDAGGVTNTVTATAQDTNGGDVTDDSDDDGTGANDPTVATIAPAPAIEGEKTITSTTAAVGETVIFQITATNTGNVTLTAVEVASDTLRRADGTPLVLTSGPDFVSADLGSAEGTLKVGETAIYEATYTLVQADIDAGGVSNIARVSGEPPLGGPAVTDVTDNGDDGDGNTTDDATILTILAEPGLAMTKALTAGGPTFDAVGDVLEYTFTVENTGNVTITDPITITDPLITDAGGAIACEPGNLVPGATLECTGSYVVTQADLDAGAVTNVASATDGATTSPDDGVTVPALQEPALTLDKLAESITEGGTTYPGTPSSHFTVGAVVAYEYTTTNTGNVTITDPITVSDNLIPAITCPAFPAAGIAPGGTFVCTGEYTVTPTDVILAFATNIASATDGTTTSPITSETVPVDGIPAIELQKTLLSGAGFSAVGDVLTYQFSVSNVGEVAFGNPVIVTDTLLGDIACYTPDVGNPDLTAGETVTCEASYTVTQDDIDAGEVLNEAYAQTTFREEGTPVTTTPDSVVTPAVLNPELTVTKSAATLPVTAVGQVLTYTINLENTGNQTLTNISAEDPMLPGFACDIAELLPAASDSCTGTYTITQDDVDAGEVVNTATATAVTPQGGAVGDSDTLTVPMPAAAPAFTLTKSASPSPFGAVGSTVTYTFAAENTGNVTLFDLTVGDAIVTPAFACTIARLDVGATDATCTLDYTVTQADVDAGEIVNSATASATDPFGTEVGASDEITTPGPAWQPALEVTKTARPVAAVLGATVTYDVTVENTGNVTITTLSLDDTLSRTDGQPTALDTGLDYVSGDTDGNLALNVGEVWTYVGTHVLSQDDVNAGGLSNTVLADGFGPGEVPVSDVSDNGDDGDGNTTDDATVTLITAAPGINAVKTVAQAGAVAGDEVVFEITVTNTGNVDLTNVTATDTLTNAKGGAAAGVVTGPTLVTTPVTPGVLAPNEVWIYELRYVLTQADVDAGGLQNTVTAAGNPPQGAPSVSDVSDNGNDSDGNTVNDPTVMGIAPAPALDVLKDITTPGAVAGDEVVFTITVTNTGNVTLSNLALSDSLSRADGTPISVGAPTFVTGDSATTIAVGGANTYELRYTLTQDDIDAGGLRNSATARGTSPGGELVSDRSRDGDPNDGNDSDDPTVLSIPSAPGLDVLKVISTPGSALNDEVVFTITVTNTGNVTLTDLVVTDTFTQVGGVDLDSSGLMLVSGDSATTLGVGAANTYELHHVLTQSDIDAGGIVNFATASGRTPTGAAVSDVSRDGDPNDGNDVDDPTELLIAPIESMAVTKTAGLPVRSGATTYDIPFTITITNTGNVTQPDVMAEDDLAAFAAPATVAGVTAPVVAGFGGANSANAGYDGVVDINLLAAGSELSPGSVGTIDFVVTIDTATGAPASSNTVLVTAGRLSAAIAASVAIVPPSDPDFTVAKSVSPTQATIGTVVTYTVTFTNNRAFPEAALTFADDLPAGVAYVPDSASWNGATTPQPTVSGSRLRWDGVTAAGAETITLTYQGRVTSGGEHTNRAYVLDAAGAVVSNVAVATVRVAPEAVFDCGDVIGKVFDDRNQNGYQDGPSGEDVNAITDQTYDGGKADTAPVRNPVGGEPGLPNARVVTVDGSVITTDEFGRFHVPCALLPSSIGSNFTLKLDERSLPTGYRVTTENPRTVRLTDGTVTKLNFGASISNVVDIDLTSAAFAQGTADPSVALRAGVDQLVAQLRDTPSVLRISYYRQGETRATAQARLDAVEALIRDRWRGTGRYRLLIERTIREVQ